MTIKQNTPFVFTNIYLSIYVNMGRKKSRSEYTEILTIAI